MTDVLLATCARMPDGEEWAGTNHLLPALAERGIDARWAVWDDPSVDWTGALVAVRSTWDYEQKLEDFLAWTGSLPWVLNSALVFAWNVDKIYLTALAETGLPVVPTTSVEEASGLEAALAAYGGGVVKPRVGAGGRGVLLRSEGEPVGDPGTGPWIVQPLVESVRTEGEYSVFVIDGHVVSQARKLPAAGEIRVHEMYGGRSTAVALTDEAADLARRTVAAAEELLGERLDYARVDQMRLPDGRLALSELELVEPGLYLEILPGNAAVFADLVAARLAAGRGAGS